MQGFAGEHVVDIAGNRAGLVETEISVQQAGDGAERVEHEVFRRWPFVGENIDFLELVGDVFLFQRKPRDACVNADA